MDRNEVVTLVELPVKDFNEDEVMVTTTVERMEKLQACVLAITLEADEKFIDTFDTIKRNIDILNEKEVGSRLVSMLALISSNSLDMLKKIHNSVKSVLPECLEYYVDPCDINAGIPQQVGLTDKWSIDIRIWAKEGE